jgi:hypothetical protein
MFGGSEKIGIAPRLSSLTRGRISPLLHRRGSRFELTGSAREYNVHPTDTTLYLNLDMQTSLPLPYDSRLLQDLCKQIFCI